MDRLKIIVDLGHRLVTQFRDRLEASSNIIQTLLEILDLLLGHRQKTLQLIIQAL